MTNVWKIGLIGLATALVLTAPIRVASAQTGASSVMPPLSGTGDMNITLEPTIKPVWQPIIEELEAPVATASPPAATASPPAAAAKPATCYYVDQNGVRHNEPCRQ